MRLTATFIFTLALVALTGCGGGGAVQEASSNASVASTPTTTAQATPTAATQPQPVKASVEEVKLAAGGAGVAAVRLDITEGFHVNANPASDKFNIPTTLQVEAQEGIMPGKPVYPSAVSRKLAFSPKPLAVYEGQAVIKLPLRADKTATPGRHTFRAKVRVQPCNDQGCLPPREIDAAIPVTIS
ncbi:MAG TPA: protein-disulfide reductase DsbD domain-containing protein [Pyrinomonadaceae bacterium]|jgi:hypothetical protein|nr:protein-disulfide reductase DsbD domain-containing protein [Pyrinomonadaceae bacterium]